MMRKYKTIIRGFLPVLLAVVVTLVLSQVFCHNLIEEETAKCWNELEMARNDVAREVSANFSTNIKILGLAADALVIQTGMNNDDTILEYLDRVQQKSLFDRIDVIFPDGTILMQDGTRVTHSGEKTYWELLEKGSHISQRVLDHYTDEITLHCFSPVYDADGKAVAILGGTVYCSTMAEFFDSARYGEDAQLFLVDLRDGNFVLDKWHTELGNIYSMGEREVPKEYEGFDYVSDIMEGNTGKVAFVSKTNGNTSYMSYMPVADTDFSLELIVQDDVLFEEVNELKDVLFWVGVVELIVLFCFAVWIYLSLQSSMRNETRAREAEFKLLQQNQEELTRQADLLTLLEENMPVGYHRCAAKPGCPFIFIGGQFTKLLGWTREEIERDFDNLYENLLWEEDKSAITTYEKMIQMIGKGNVYDTSIYRMKHKDGGYRWVTDSTIFVDLGEDSFFQATISDITQHIEGMEEARRQAEESNRAKSTFLFNLSHDIRTPMNAILGFSHIIGENAENASLVRDTIAKIIQAGETLMSLLNDVLELSRIERGKEDVNVQPIHMHAHGQNLIEMFSKDMEDAGIEFKVEADLEHEYVMIDPLKVSRIGMNMLSNAKKFTPAGGTVIFGIKEIACDGENVTYCLYTRDTGIGMSEEFQKRAFEQFERERSATESGVSGSGLGMAIISKLTTLMGGTVSLESELGKGTEISATLTFALAKDADMQHEKSAGKALEVSGKRILLVEDNEFNREIARYILEDMGFVVEEAHNGAIALDKMMQAGADTYQLILMDIQMPVMDGYRATQEIRRIQDVQKAQIPIIAMTANAFEEDRKRCLEIGMNGHIGKPLEREKLLQELSNVL